MRWTKFGRRQRQAPSSGQQMVLEEAVESVRCAAGGSVITASAEMVEELEPQLDAAASNADQQLLPSQSISCPSSSHGQLLIARSRSSQEDAQAATKIQATFRRYLVTRPLSLKEETDSRLQRKAEAFIQRQRALAYAYSRRASKDMSKHTRAAMTMQLKSAELPWRWDWFEQRFPAKMTQHQAFNKSKSSPDIWFNTSSSKYMQPTTEPTLCVLPTPRSTGSTPAIRARSAPNPAILIDGSTRNKQHKVSATMSWRDDKSLTSHPQFSTLNYMVPTMSTKTKVQTHMVYNKASKVRGLKQRLKFLPTRGQVKGSVFTNKETQTELSKNVSSK